MQARYVPLIKLTRYGTCRHKAGYQNYCYIYRQHRGIDQDNIKLPKYHKIHNFKMTFVYMWVCGRWFAGNVGSNPAWGMDVSLASGCVVK